MNFGYSIHFTGCCTCPTELAMADKLSPVMGELRHLAGLGEPERVSA